MIATPRARTCRGGLVTAPHHLAAEAGASVLRDGGNPLEAMIAAAATIAVVYPHMNGIGGDGFWLIARPGKVPIGIQACGPAAGLATLGRYASHGQSEIPTRGPDAALTVAGAIGGWMLAGEIARDWGGRIPLPRLLEDAMRHARDGIPVSRSHHRLMTEKWEELKDVPGFTAGFAPDGPPDVGDIQKQPELAATFDYLSRTGLDDFYRGDVARTLASGLEATGSPVRLSDLESYRASIKAPAHARLKCGDVFNMPPPTQGVASLMILRLFEALGVCQPDGFEHVHTLVEATKRAYLLRNAELGDPSRMTSDWRAWLGDDIIDREARAIDPNRAAPWPAPPNHGDTIWMGAADANGMVVSYIQSLFWEFGSGVVVPQTGILWQNRGAGFSLYDGPNQLGPGRVPFHTLNPAMARLNDGTLLAYGTMGGDGQPQTQSAIFTRHIHFGQDMQAAVSAPRWLLGRTWGDTATTLKLEDRFHQETIEHLRDAGHPVEVLTSFEDRMGHAGMVSISRDGTITGASDPRSDGACASL